MSSLSKQIFLNLTTAILVVVVLFGTACSKEPPEKIGAVKDRKKMPMISAKKITTVISDSGVTRYRIVTDKMEIFDRASEPYWDFPKGIYFERFAPDLSIDANFRSNIARYYERKKLWEFKDKVKAINLNGDMFETDLIYWNEAEHKIYSDQFIRITRSSGVTTGVGFDADESFTKWRILNPTMDMYVKKDE